MSGMWLDVSLKTCVRNILDYVLKIYQLLGSSRVNVIEGTYVIIQEGIEYAL